jgi:hypothetical protein
MQSRLETRSRGKSAARDKSFDFCKGCGTIAFASIYKKGSDFVFCSRTLAHLSAPVLPLTAVCANVEHLGG